RLVAGAYTLEERQALRFEAIRRPRPRAPSQGLLGGQVEKISAVGPEVAVDPVGQRPDALDRPLATRALVGHRRVGEAVADHPGAAGKRRPHPALEMVLASREHEQQLGLRVHGLAEQHGAKCFGEVGAARLAGEQDHPARLAQAIGIPLEMRALAGAVDPLEADEPASHLDSPVGERRRSWNSRTARLWASSVSENWLLPSPLE